MKYGVSSNTLLLTAGVVWLVAGLNILQIGVSCWITDTHYWLLKVCEASLVFLLFFCMVFHKLYRKHTQRITSGKRERHCPFSFFDVKGWIVMAFMIGMGVTIRKAHLCRKVSSPYSIPDSLWHSLPPEGVLSGSSGKGNETADAA